MAPNSIKQLLDILLMQVTTCKKYSTEKSLTVQQKIEMLQYSKDMQRLGSAISLEMDSLTEDDKDEIIMAFGNELFDVLKVK